MRYYGEWADVPCNMLYPFICSDVKGQNVTFAYVNQTMTFPDAQRYCREQYTDLASVRDMAENQKIYELIPAGQIAWIGLFRDCWKWVDGSNASFTYWNTGKPDSPDNYCAAAYFAVSGKWEDWTCDWKRAFICYSAPVLKQVMRVKLERKSSLDLNDVAMQEELLNKIKLKLEDQGVKKDVKLSWWEHTDGKIFHKDEEEDEQ
ncbi:L-selectin-like [Melanotaenia boesemani]|uniref:L-selectin-like n=1 Tax=Melanotaenia boesemani TaxID=1250792 RepID=UPI001C04ECE6|nr:L-selectin-like [Melanotaenia boesemani]